MYVNGGKGEGHACQEGHTRKGDIQAKHDTQIKIDM